MSPADDLTLAVADQADRARSALARLALAFPDAPALARAAAAVELDKIAARLDRLATRTAKAKPAK